MRRSFLLGVAFTLLTATACTSNTVSPIPASANQPSLPSPSAPPSAHPPTHIPGESPSFTPTIAPSASASPVSNAIVSDVDLTDGDQQVAAYLVEPASAEPGSAAGIVWFHWLETGDPTSNRTEFLSEASALADKGVVSVLVDGQFPWHDTPVSADHDVAAVQNDADMVKQAVELLRSNSAVDQSRIALVGHDFGAMYSSVVFGEDRTISALVMMAPTARWADWFLPYWPHEDDPDAYQAVMKPLDPVTELKRANDRPVLLQFATEDVYVSQETAQEITNAAGGGAERKDYETDHSLKIAAVSADRDAWLAQILALGPRPS